MPSLSFQCKYHSEMYAYNDHIFGCIVGMPCPISISFENNEIRKRGAFNDSNNILQIMV